MGKGNTLEEIRTKTSHFNETPESPLLRSSVNSTQNKLRGPRGDALQSNCSSETDSLTHQEKVTCCLSRTWRPQAGAGPLEGLGRGPLGYQGDVTSATFPKTRGRRSTFPSGQGTEWLEPASEEMRLRQRGKETRR